MVKAMMAWLAVGLSSAALADSPPDVRVDADGTVVGRMLIEADESDVREAISSVQRTNVSANVLEQRFLPDGGCTSIFRKTRGMFSPMEMNTRLCPTATGWRESLVDSSDFSAYESEWVLRPSGAGTELQLRVRSEINLAVPSALVRRGTAQGVRETFSAVLGRVLKKKSAPEEP